MSGITGSLIIVATILNNLVNVITTCAQQLAAECPKRDSDKQSYQLVDVY